MTRPEFQTALETVLGSDHVYFNPPEKMKLQYPAIVYRIDPVATRSADNGNYFLQPGYLVTYIEEKTNDENWLKLLHEFPMSRFSRHFVSDGMHHYTYIIYV